MSRTSRLFSWAQQSAFEVHCTEQLPGGWMQLYLDVWLGWCSVIILSNFSWKLIFILVIVKWLGFLSSLSFPSPLPPETPGPLWFSSNLLSSHPLLEKLGFYQRRKCRDNYQNGPFAWSDLWQYLRKTRYPFGGYTHGPPWFYLSNISRTSCLNWGWTFCNTLNT